MTTHDQVALPAGWRRFAPWLPDFLRLGCTYTGPLGEIVRVNHNGFLDLVTQGGRPHGGVASDPAMGGRPRRYP
jgi:hypothetical protein